MSRNFVVAPLDLDSNARYFSSPDKAVAFAAQQAKGAWALTDWTVKVVNGKREDTGIRLNVDVSHQVRVLDHGKHVSYGSIASNGRLLVNCPAWDLLDPYLSKKA